MATYAIGDIQGCMSTLEKLLAKIEFDPAEDRVWLAGDLVNRGPRSLAVLRWARDLGNRARVVLGNHDLHLLAAWSGLRKRKSLDTLDRVLEAKDGPELIDWLRTRPIMHRGKGHAMVHAGLHPRWSLKKASRLAGELEAALSGDDWQERLAAIYSGRMRSWRKSLEGDANLRAALSFFVGVRCVLPDGTPCDYRGRPEDAPGDCQPWYADRDDDEVLLFGHWALHGHRRTKRWVALDSGCVWGGKLTAYRLGDRAVFQVKAID